MNLSVCLPACLSVRPSICLSVCLSALLSRLYLWNYWADGFDILHTKRTLPEDVQRCIFVQLMEKGRNDWTLKIDTNLYIMLDLPHLCPSDISESTWSNSKFHTVKEHILKVCNDVFLYESITNCRNDGTLRINAVNEQQEPTWKPFKREQTNTSAESIIPDGSRPFPMETLNWWWSSCACNMKSIGSEIKTWAC